MFDAPETPSVNFENLQKSSNTLTGILSILTALTVYARTETHFQDLDPRQNYLANFLVISTFLIALIPALRETISQTAILALTVAAAQIGIFYYLNQGGNHQ